MEQGIFIDHEIQQFLSEVAHQFSRVRKKHVELFGRDITLGDSESKGWGMVRELLQRKRKFPTAAKMTKQEEIAVAKFGDFLLRSWHEMHATDPDKRPDVTRFYRPAVI